MKAITITTYGGPEVLQLQEKPMPVLGEHDVLIKVKGAALNAADWHVMMGDPYLFRLQMGLFKPKADVLGADVAGIVVEAGSKVTKFTAGDAVFGDLSGYGFGACAEYAAAHEDAFALKPANISFEQAAAAPLAGITALSALGKAGIKLNYQECCANPKVLIVGASGGVGTFLVQLAKLYGAEVTAICSAAKMPLVNSLGADHVIDYTKQDFTKSNEKYDAIIAVNGYHHISAYKQALSPNGTYVMVGGKLKQMMQSIFLGKLYSEKNGRQLHTHMSVATPADMEMLRILLEDGQIHPVIDKVYDLLDTPEAMRYLLQGHAAGKIVINISSVQ